MKIIRMTLLSSVVALGCAGAMAAEPQAAEPPQASIPFVSLSQSIQGWQADGNQALWIQDVRKQWYYAKLQIPCSGLEFAAAMGFEPRTTGSLDRFGTVLVSRDNRCPIASLTKSSAPPAKKKK